MSYIVSHQANYEPSGHRNYPDKEFETYDEAQKYFSKKRDACRKSAEEQIKSYPKLFESEVMKQDLFHDIPSFDEWTLAGFSFHKDYTYHIYILEEL